MGHPVYPLLFRQQKKYQRSPDKSDISSPCGFEHLVSIGSRDYTKFFSLQTFVNRNLPISMTSLLENTFAQYGNTGYGVSSPVISKLVRF